MNRRMIFGAIALIACMSTRASAERTWNDVVSELSKFERATVIDAYRRHGKRDAKWDADAETLLEAQTSYDSVHDLHPVYQRSTGTMSAKERAGLAHRILDAGCSDPIVIYHAVRAMEQNNELAERERYRIAAMNLKNAEYGIVWRTRLLQSAVDRMEYAKPLPSDIEEWRTLRDQAFRQLLAEADATTEFRQVVWSMFPDIFATDSVDERDHFSRLAETTEHADPWLSNVLIGSMEIKRAWAKRGSGFAGDVTPEGWRGFAEHLKLARTRLDAAAAADSNLPQPYSYLIVVSKGEDNAEQLHLAFETAISRQVDYMAAYDNYLDGLRPRWGGSYEQMMEVGIDALKAGRFDTAVPASLVTAINAIASEFSKEDAAILRAEVAPQVTRMFEGYVANANNPEAPVVDWAQTKQVLWLFKCERWKEAGASLASMKKELLPSLLQDESLEGLEVRGQCFARSGSSSAAVEAALIENNAKKRSDAFAAVQQTLQSDDPAQPWIEQKRASAEFESRLLVTEWTDFPPGAELASWWTQRGDWVVAEDGSIIGTFTDGLRLLSKIELPLTYEMRCDVEQVGERSDKSVVYVWPGLSAQNSIGMRMDFKTWKVRPLVGGKLFFEEQLNHKDGVATLHVRVNKEGVSILDEATRGSNTTLIERGGNGSVRRLMLGGSNTTPGTKWRFSRIQFRQISPSDAKKPDYRSKAQAEKDATQGR